MKSVIGYIESLSDQPKVMFCLLLSMLIATADFITGDYSLTLFYVLPIAMASWFIGKRAALYIALFCGIGLYSIDLLVAPGKFSVVSLRSWNALMEVGYLFMTAYLISVVRIEMEKSRQRSIELEFLNQELNAFSYTVAHDLRSPLVWIGGYCLIILKHHNESLDEETRNYLEEMYGGIHRMEQLIVTLLEFSQLAQDEIIYESSELSAMAKSVAEELTFAEPGRRVTFKIAEGITGNGDQRLLRVIMENLLNNAWKYTGEQEVTVIEFGETRYNGKRTYYVRDNGAGFDMAFAQKLFVPFQRLHNADRFEGHGVGLATVKRIVSRHKGEIWAESQPGDGATFYFTLNS